MRGSRVVHDPETGVAEATLPLIDLYNTGYQLGGSLDGFPFPPPDLVNLVIGTRELAWYQLGGLFMHEAISSLLRRHGTPIESFSSILDFGCGCGRILRWWAALRAIQTEIWGSDYNPVLIEWCREHLSGFAQFTVNGPEPTLDFPDRKFGFVYAYSVFTHFAPELQIPWFAEMVRVLQPGGTLLVTVHGTRVALRMGFSLEQLAQLESEGLMVFGSEQHGANACAAYHAERFMRDRCMLGLELVDFLPGGVRDSSEQDIYLYRKTAAA